MTSPKERLLKKCKELGYGELLPVVMSSIDHDNYDEEVTDSMLEIANLDSDKIHDAIKKSITLVNAAERANCCPKLLEKIESSEQKLRNADHKRKRKWDLENEHDSKRSKQKSMELYEEETLKRSLKRAFRKKETESAVERLAQLLKVGQGDIEALSACLRNKDACYVWELLQRHRTAFACIEHLIIKCKRGTVQDRFDTVFGCKDVTVHYFPPPNDPKAEFDKFAVGLVHGDVLVVPTKSLTENQTKRLEEDGVNVVTTVELPRLKEIPEEIKLGEIWEQYKTKLDKEDFRPVLDELDETMSAAMSGATRNQAETRFQSLEIEGFGAFEKKTVLLYRNGVHLITAEAVNYRSNGLGKTTISTTAFVWVLTGLTDKRSFPIKPSVHHLINDNANDCFVELRGSVHPTDGGEATEFLLTRRAMTQKARMEGAVSTKDIKDVSVSQGVPKGCYRFCGETQTVDFRWGREAPPILVSKATMQSLIGQGLFGRGDISNQQLRDLVISTTIWNSNENCAYLDLQPKEEKLYREILYNWAVLDNVVTDIDRRAASANNKVNECETAVRKCEKDKELKLKDLHSKEDRFAYVSGNEVELTALLNTEKDTLSNCQKKLEPEEDELESLIKLSNAPAEETTISEARRALVERSLNAREDVTKYETIVNNALLVSQSAKVEHNAFKVKLQNLENIGEVCGTCYRPKDDIVLQHLSETKEKVTDYEEEANKANNALKNARTKLQNAKSRKKRADQSLQEVKDALELSVKQKKGARDEAKGRVDATEARLKTLTANLNQLTDEIEHLKLAIAKIQTAEDREKQSKAEAQTQLDALNKVKRDFASSGSFRDLVTAEVITCLLTRANVYLKRFFHDLNTSTTANVTITSTLPKALREGTVQQLDEEQQSDVEQQLDEQEGVASFRGAARHHTSVCMGGVERPPHILSTSEYRRLQVSLFLAYRDLLQHISGVSNNLIIFDEPFSTVDGAATVMMLDSLDQMVSDESFDDEVGPSSSSQLCIMVSSVSPMRHIRYGWRSVVVLTGKGEKCEV